MIIWSSALEVMMLCPSLLEVWEVNIRSGIAFQTCSECLWFAPCCPYTAWPPAYWKLEDESDVIFNVIMFFFSIKVKFWRMWQLNIKQRLVSSNKTLDIWIAYTLQQTSRSHCCILLLTKVCRPAPVLRSDTKRWQRHGQLFHQLATLRCCS